MDIVTLGAALKGSKKYTDQVTQSLMGGVHYRGEVDYYANLPSNPEEGDAYTVRYSGTSGTDLDGTEYVWSLNHQTQQYTWIDFSKDSYTKTETNNLLARKQNVIDSTHKLASDLVDDRNSTTNKFCYMDSNGNLFIGGVQVTQIIDSASYEALTTKENRLYLVYPNGGV